MSLPPILAEFDWNSVFVILVPLLYFAMQFLGSAKKDDKENSAPPGKGGQPDPSAQERLRRVQEEIRRKIAERQEQVRRVMEGEDPRETPAAPPAQTYDPNRPEWAQRRESPPPRPATSSMPRSSQPPPRPAPEPAPMPSRPMENALDRQLREQRERLARAKREREEAYAKASGLLHRAMGGNTGHPHHGAHSSARDAVLVALHSPQAARNAIVLSEILGPPRATREYGMDP